MRIVRLCLERYGHVSGEVLDFPAEVGLHVVLGANEAGKSTALEAVADGLFGFNRKFSRKLNHPDDPRVGLTLRASDGTEASFIRRKNGKDKLLDGAGAALPEAALARFLGGTSRERFTEVFGLDGERLRQAGRAIMSEHGEAGAAILQAQTGLRGLRDVVERLDDEAKALFGDGRGARRINVAATAVKDNRRLVADRSLSGTEYVRATEREAELASRLETITAEREDLRAKQSQLERIRRTAPVRGALAQAAKRLETLGPISPLPLDAAARRAEALVKQDQSARDLGRDQAKAAEVETALGQLDLDPAVLQKAAAIAALIADASRVTQIGRDRLKVAGQATESLATLDDMAQRLGVPEREAALRSRLPDAATRRAAERLLNEHIRQAGARGAATETLRRAERAAQKAADDFAALPAPADTGALRDVVEAASHEGAIDAALAEAAWQDRSAAADAAAALAGLPLWTGSLVQLEASPVPLEAEDARLGNALDAAVADLAAADQELRQHDAAIVACRAAMAGITRAGPLPTPGAIAVVRDRRDAAWRLLRRSFVEGGAPPSAEDWPGEIHPAPAELPDLLDRLLHEADALADRRTTEMARVVEWEARLDEEARLLAARAGLVAVQGSAEARFRDAREAWQATWRPTGVEPLDPAAMREWVRSRDGVLRAARAARDAEGRHAVMAERQATLRGRLLVVLPGMGGDVAILLQRASRQLRMMDEQGARNAAAADMMARTATERDETKAVLDDIDRLSGPWQEAWASVALRLSLPTASGAEAATDALNLWSDVAKHLEGWSALDGRIRDMQRSLDDHDAALCDLAAQLDLPVSEQLVAELAARLKAAQNAEREHVRLLGERAALADAIAGHECAGTEAAAAHEALLSKAGAADDAALVATIARAAEHADLARILRERTAELRQQDDGKTDAELESEAAAIDIDAIPGRLAEITTRLTALDDEAKDHAAQAAVMRQTLQAMAAGQDVAGPAQVIEDSLTEIEDATHRYIRLRLAHALLHSGIDGFRRSQQGPLLAKASELFAELTGRQYGRLEQDVGEKNEPVIVAVRPDGSTCAADMLSEGTRDQLFLSLRLASIALDAVVSEPLPFIADDLLVNFDDNRAAAALRLLAKFGQVTQVILFTHHDHLVRLIDQGISSLHRLPREMVN